jgi:ADP-ribosylarginine hydrolase
LHMATGMGLINKKKSGFDIELYGKSFMNEYLKSMDNLPNSRYPGKMTLISLKMLKNGTDWNEIPYAIPGTGDGNGATIRTSCIGLAFYKETELDKLIAVSIEAARITHNSVVGYTGALNASYFVSLAIRGVHYSKWPQMFIDLLESNKIEDYLEKSGRGVKEFKRDKNYCITIWKKYCLGRFIGKNMRYAEFMNNPAYRNKYFANNFGLPRDTINTTFYSAGKGALDCVIVAYDAFVDSMMNEKNPSWEKLIIYSAIHSGDSDSTGAVAGSFWGAYNGFDGVPKANYSKLEYLEELNEIGHQIFSTYYK